MFCCRNMNKSSTRTLLTALLVVMVTGALSAGAYTTFSADRTATLDIVNDASGIVELAPGNSTIVTTDTDGALDIDATNTGASGVNVDSTLSIGDTASPTTDYAFSVTNGVGSAKDITLSYAAATDPANTQLTFTVYDSAGAQVATFNEGGSYTITGAGSGSTYYVVLDADTTGTTASTDDLSGTLTVTSN